jgi:hypothetical protein
LEKCFIPQPYFVGVKESSGMIMKQIVAYLVILLAISSLALTLTPGVYSQTENVKVVNYSYHFDSSGILVVAGEIQNNGPNIVSQVILSGTAQTSYGVEMLSGDIAWASNILPGQKAPFFMQIRSKPHQQRILGRRPRQH